MSPRQAKQEAERLKAFETYLTVCQGYLDKAHLTLGNLEKPHLLDIQIQALQTTIKEFMQHADRQIDQIRCRVLQGKVIPRKGKLSQQAQAIESSKEFIEARDKHSAVESAINALEVHGLDICPDHGIHGFKRYVSLAVLARNIHRIGCILNQRDKKRAARKNKKLARANALELLI